MTPIETEPGDLVLVSSPGRLYRAVCRLAKSPYDHVAVVSSRGDTINIDKPGARRVPVARLLRPSLRPLVLRPRFATTDERSAFVGDIEQLVGAPYDVARTLWLVERLLERAVTGRTRALAPLGRDRVRWICTDAVLLALERHVRAFAQVRDLARDWSTIGSATTNDLLEVHRLRPDLLAAP